MKNWSIVKSNCSVFLTFPFCHPNWSVKSSKRNETCLLSSASSAGGLNYDCSWFVIEGHTESFQGPQVASKPSVLHVSSKAFSCLMVYLSSYVVLLLCKKIKKQYKIFLELHNQSHFCMDFAY